ncbi:MAG: type VI secretion system baseplate subunit TssK [Phycisphaerae bacterium]|nr:type VI secretion system baseplate subunit TssK [Phycisphaerae bacterium]
MFLRPHHLQSGQRYLEALIRTALDSSRPFAWGFTELHVAKEPLENFTLRLDRSTIRLKDGTWVRIPDNTEVDPLNFKEQIEQNRGVVDIFFGVPTMQEVRANAVSLENPESTTGSPRYEPHPVSRRDENTGENPQIVYTRRMRGRLFTQFDDMTGYEVVRVGRVKRTDRAGALPEMDDLGTGPLLALQADAGLSVLVRSLSDQIEAKDEVLAREAREHRMLFTDGVAANTEHLIKLHVLNEVRGGMKALLQCPVLHPFDVFTTFAKLVGHLSVFHEDLVPIDIPNYDHDRPGDSLERLRARIVVLLEAMRPVAYIERPFVLKKDDTGREGLEVELDRKWIDENLEMFVALIADDLDINELYAHVYQKLDMKLASPSRSRRIHNIAVKGLSLQIKSVPAGSLPRRQNLHYFKVDKTIGPDRTDYWKECEQERGIRMSIREGQLAGMTRFKPALYVALKS